MLKKAKMVLAIMVSIIVFLFISNVFFYARMLNLQADLDHTERIRADYWEAIQSLYEEIEDLKQPEFYTTDLNWTVYEESSGLFRIEVEGVVFNAGEYGATYVVAYPSFRIFSLDQYSYLADVTPENFTISRYLVNGVFEGKTFREFSQTFHTDNLFVWDIIDIEIGYEYSVYV